VSTFKTCVSFYLLSTFFDREIESTARNSITFRLYLHNTSRAWNGYKYQLIAVDLSWHEAKNECIRQGSHLVSIDNKEEHDVINSKLRITVMFLIHIFLIKFFHLTSFCKSNLFFICSFVHPKPSFPRKEAGAKLNITQKSTNCGGR
jgi:hypothetical protein